MSKIFKPLVIVFGLTICLSLGSLFTLNAKQDTNQPNNFVLTQVENTTISQDAEGVFGIPKKILIPAIKVEANLQNLGLDKNGAIGSPEGPYDAGWFNLSAKPGEKGSAIITGHYGQWRNGVGSVFDNLSKLKPGDSVIITDDTNRKINFTVQYIKIYEPQEEVPQLFKSDDTYLNLITCNGEWLPSQKTYTNRLVVFTKMDK